MRGRQKNEKIRAQYAGLTTESGKWNGQIRLLWKNLMRPLRTRKAQTWAVWNDLFAAPDEFIDEAFGMMLACHILTNIPDHVFMVLTKRHKRMLEYFTMRKPVELLKAWANTPRIILDDPDVLFEELVYSATCRDWDENGANSGGSEHRPWGYINKLWPLPNVYLGVTAENQEQADKRIPVLRQIPAAVRFVSVEPMLGPVDFSEWIGEYFCSNCNYRGFEVGPENEDGEDTCPKCGSGEWWFTEAEYHGGLDPEERQPLNLIIAGAESGPGARICPTDCFRSLRDQCQYSGTKFFLKQMYVNGKLVKMPELDGRIWAQWPEVQP